MESCGLLVAPSSITNVPVQCQCLQVKNWTSLLGVLISVFVHQGMNECEFLKF